MPAKKLSQQLHPGVVILITLLGILMTYIIVLLGAMIRTELKEYAFIGRSSDIVRTIHVSGEGEVTMIPNIAHITLGSATEGETVAEAQEANSKQINALIDRVKGLGVEENDIRTQNYNVYPRYEYTEEKGRVQKGFEVNQQVRVKVRDIDVAPQILALAGDLGLTNVGGLQFTFDNEDEYRDQAREEALKNARQKAQQLADVLDVDVVGVVSYEEGGAAGFSPQFMKSVSSFDEFGVGGTPPNIEPGDQKVTVQVHVEFEIQ